MSKVVAGMAMSLDGFVADRDGDASRLYGNLAELRESALVQDAIRATGAVAMGRRSYEMAEGDFTGYEFQVPIFVITLHPPERVAKGENENLRFHFVPDGVETAIAQAKAAAGGRDVTVVGGADVIRQLLRLGLVDELVMGIVPVLLGDGLRLFEGLEGEEIELEQTEVIESPSRTDLRLRVVR